MKLPLGYLYSATYAGIRQAEKDDLALIVSGLPASAALILPPLATLFLVYAAT